MPAYCFSPLVKCSKGVCGGWGGGGPHAQNRTGGSADTWKALQHTTCGCSLLPRGERGWSVAGRLAPPSAVQTNVLRVHHRAFSYKAAVTSNPPKKTPGSAGSVFSTWRKSITGGALTSPSYKTRYGEWRRQIYKWV